MDYEKKYKEALETARKINSGEGVAAPPDWTICEVIFPELKESEEEKIRKELIQFIKNWKNPNNIGRTHDFPTLTRNVEQCDRYIAWLEKQGDTNETINRNEFARGVLRGAAINLITWIDYKAYEGSMCLSNTECKDITDALVNGDWDKIYAYMKKKLEKQGEQNHKIIKGKNYFCVKTHNYAGVEWIKGTKYYASDNYTLVNQGCEYYCPEYSKEEHNNLFEEVKYDGCVENKMSANKVEPKFKVGDIIIKSRNSDINKFGKFKITDIKYGRYWYNEFVICEISEQDEWELVGIEAKFKVGNWVVWDNRISCHVDNIYQGENSLRYTITDTNNMTRSYSVKGFDNNAHLWTIQDAKDGDVLKEDSCIFIIERMKSNGIAIVHCCLFDDGDFDFGSTLSFDVDNTYPATKEQRDLLFKKMKEAGWEWDSEKKELRKIEKQCEQKPKWSEEDERHYTTIIKALHSSGAITPIDMELAEKWFKSLKKMLEEQQ